MGSRSAIRRLATRAALAATVVSLVASAPAAAATDQYGNSLTLLTLPVVDAPCNPFYAVLDVVPVPDYSPGAPLFLNGVAWADYFGIPVAVSPPFRVTSLLGSGRWGAIWPVPSSSPSVPGQAVTLPGQYAFHVLLQGNGEISPPLYFVFSTVSDTAGIFPGLKSDCSPIEIPFPLASASRAAIRKPPQRVLARRVWAARRNSDKWFERSLGPRANYPKGRFCGRTICVQRRAGAAWKPITQR
jgi:hypothetical protein